MSLSLLFQRLLFCGCVLAPNFFSLTSQAELAAVGGESALTAAAIGDQIFPDVAIGADGGYVIWQDNSVTTLGPRVVANRLGNDLTPSGNSFLVSSAFKSKTAGDQEKPRVALLSTGNAVCVWQGGKPGQQQIYARFINASGLLSKADIRVGSHPKNNQINPALTPLNDGSVVVAWAALDQDGSRQGIFAQRLSATGSKLGKEFQVNQFTLNNQRSPSVATLADGRFVVAWVSELQRNPTSSIDIMARIFLPDGTPSSEEIPVSVSTTNACANPSVASSPAGGFALAWSQRDDVGRGTVGPVDGSGSNLSSNGWDILVRLFDSNGTAAGTPFRLNSTAFGDQYVPKLASLANSYVGLWTSLGQDGSREGIYGQAFGSDGALQGSEFLVNTTTISRQIHPTIASDRSNRCLAVWSSISAGSGFDLFSQMYSSTGQ